MRSKQRSLFRAVHRTVGYWFVLGLLTLTGCGDGRIARYPVTGKVLVDGQPAAGAMVIFCPVEGSDELMRERPIGVTDSDGTFQLTTFTAGDGAPEGDFKVLVHWPGSTPQGKTDDRRRQSIGPDRLRGKYFNLDTTPLTATVEGPTDLPPFELTSK